MSNSTLSGNSGANGGGILNEGALTIKNSIVANSSRENCFSFGAPIISQGHNLSDDGSCAGFFIFVGDRNNTPAGLDPSGLQNNGGPTQTIALLPTSPAVDAIPVSPVNYCTDVIGMPVTTDQRGVSRPQGPACDIGAFELVQANLEAITATGTTFGATEGVTFTGTVATFTDPDRASTAAEYSATIDWGDATQPTPGTISGQGGQFTVSGTHTYASTGTFLITTTINDVDGSSTTTPACSVTVFAFATAKGAAFVIGDLEAGLGNHVTWWSSQWANINLMSGGPPPNSMKGFAGFEDNFLGLPPPNCGGSWSTDTGNSTPPPPSVPNFMGVIVSSMVTQSGSIISGDIKQVVIVRNDPGYGPSPGHPGTGTEIAVVCMTP